MVDCNDMYNADELQPPSWLNEIFLLEVLRQFEQCQSIKIISLRISPGTAKSDHYASIMFRIKLVYDLNEGRKGSKTRTRSMILKTTPDQEGVKKELMGEMHLFETEIHMYTKILPSFEAILRQHGDNTLLCAKPLFQQLEPRQCIIFEDLTEIGFQTIVGRACTLVEAKLAFLKLAKIHAISYKLANEGESEVTQFCHGAFNSPKVEDLDLVKNAIPLFKEVLDMHDDLRVYIPHVERVEKNILQHVKDIFNAHSNGKRCGIQALNHGDFHMKNMMVRYTNGELNDLMLLDYQMSIFGSVAIDLLYSFVMLMSSEMRLNHRDELFNYYFEQFCETLKQLHFSGNIPKKSEFEHELWEHRQLELFLFISILCANYVFQSANGDLQRIVEDESYRREIIMQPDILTEFRQLLPRFVSQGYFDE